MNLRVPSSAPSFLEITVLSSLCLSLAVVNDDDWLLCFVHFFFLTFSPPFAFLSLFLFIFLVFSMIIICLWTNDFLPCGSLWCRRGSIFFFLWCERHLFLLIPFLFEAMKVKKKLSFHTHVVCLYCTLYCSSSFIEWSRRHWRLWRYFEYSGRRKHWCWALAHSSCKPWTLNQSDFQRFPSSNAHPVQMNSTKRKRNIQLKIRKDLAASAGPHRGIRGRQRLDPAQRY